VPGAAIADLVMQLFGLASIVALFPVVAWGWQMLNAQAPARPRVGAGVLALLAATLALACLPNPAGWPLPVGIGGAIGDTLLAAPTTLLGKGEWVRGVIGVMAGAVGLWFLWKTVTGSPAPVMEADDADEMDEPAPRRAIRVGQGLEPAERPRPTRAVADDFDDEDSEGRFAAVVGLVQHWGLTARARLGRLVGGGRGPRLREGFGDGFKGKLGRVLSPMEDEADHDAPPARRVEPQVAPRVNPDRAAAPQPRGVDPRMGEPRMAEPRVVDPSAGEPRVARSPSAVPPRAPAYDDAYADDQPELDADDVEAVDDADDPPFDPAPIQRPTRGPAATVGLSQRPAAAAPARPAAPAPKVSQVPEDERRVAVTPPAKPMAPSPRVIKEAQARLPLLRDDGFQLPPLTLLAEPKRLGVNEALTPEVLEQNARDLEGVLEDFGVKGEIINVRPGPVVTLYELEPAPGIKSSRVIGLADDIARSMSAISARVAVIPGKNAIGIELPNHKRETVYLRELVGSKDFDQSKQKLALALGKTIGGEAVIVDLARTPHMLVAGTTGSGKSVSINTMILSLVYRLTPEQCKLIMIDPKMLELSVYDGIPHLLSPVVTDPKKAVVALKWTVREMEDRYRKMSKLGVRNIDGFNARVIEAKEQGEGHQPPDPDGL
jgi:DNA segregation ATPase FtsK/SpoIIIE, S-DNA-T family